MANTDLAFSSKVAKLTIAQLVRGVLYLIVFSFSISSYSVSAEIGKVTVSGEVIDPNIFQAYINVILPDPNYCHPNTATFVVDKVLERILIRNAAKDQNLSRASAIDEFEDELRQRLKRLPKNVSAAERDELVITILSMESDGYASTLLKTDDDISLKDKYLYRLATNDPLVVNVTLLRTAIMEFNDFDAAEDVLQRLTAKEEFDRIAIELGLNDYRYEDRQSIWRHASSFALLENNLIKKDSIIGPYYVPGRWQIHKVLETKNLPVALLDDVIGENYTTINSLMRQTSATQRRDTAIDKLRAEANVEIDGKPAPVSGHLTHCTETLF